MNPMLLNTMMLHKMVGLLYHYWSRVQISLTDCLYFSSDLLTVCYSFIYPFLLGGGGGVVIVVKNYFVSMLKWIDSMAEVLEILEVYSPHYLLHVWHIWGFALATEPHSLFDDVRILHFILVSSSNRKYSLIAIV